MGEKTGNSIFLTAKFKIMRTLTVLVFLVFTITPFLAQDEVVSDRSSLTQKINLKTTEWIIDFNLSQSNMFDEEMYGGSFASGVLFSDVWYTGFAIDFASSSRIDIPTQIEVINPRMMYSFFGWHNEILLLKNRIINFSIPFRAGIASFNYSDQYATWEGREPSVIKDNTFAMMGGLNMYINISPYFSLGGGAMYRNLDTSGRFGSNLSQEDIYYSINFRFALPRSAFEE